MSSSTYYLRARNYRPTTGRFLTEDKHWNSSNMIYGDEPLKWNERKSDPNAPSEIHTPICQISMLYSKVETYIFTD